MVGQHHTTGTYPYFISTTRHITNHYRRSGGSYAFHIVVLGKPIPGVAKSFSFLCQLEAASECIAGTLALYYSSKV
jgi:hypothetical protein